jgi:hypothetical protein
MDLKLGGFPPKHRRAWLVGFEAQKVLAWRLLKSRFSVLGYTDNDIGGM